MALIANRTLAALGEWIQLFVFCDGRCAVGNTISHGGFLGDICRLFLAYSGGLLSALDVWDRSSQGRAVATLQCVVKQSRVVCCWHMLAVAYAAPLTQGLTNAGGYVGRDLSGHQ